MLTGTSTVRGATRLAAALLVMGGLLAGLVVTPEPVDAQVNCTVTDEEISVDGVEAQALAEVNAFRQAHGLGALQQSPVLNRAAAWISRDQYLNTYDAGAKPNHPDSLGRLIPQRQMDCGYPAADGQENLYWGEGVVDGIAKGTPQAAVQWWKDSPFGHREAMLKPGHRFAGIARACTDKSDRCYWALELGGQGSGVAPPDAGVPGAPAPAGGAPAPGAPAPAGKPAIPSLPWVQQGAGGEKVTTIQYLLRHHGADIEVDGDFGPVTEQAVRGFQQAKGLDADGVVGPQTWPALFVTVRRGDQGDAVRAAQSLLASRGVDVDGDFGSRTEVAVQAFQRANGLAADGIVGPPTWAALVAAS